MTVEIRKYTGGKVASSRKNAINIINIEKIEKIDFYKSIIFDFYGIEVATHCFIDELIGVYIEKIGKIPDNLTFKNCNDYVKEQIKFVITERLSKVKVLTN